jgi:hypothetical protein
MPNFYIDTDNFTTATAVFTDITLITKAPNGYYSFDGNYRQQVSGLLQNLTLCDPYYSYIDVALFTNGTSAPSGYITCPWFSNPDGEYTYGTFYADTGNLQVGDILYYDTALTQPVEAILDLYFPYYQGNLQKWVGILAGTSVIGVVGYCN